MCWLRLKVKVQEPGEGESPTQNLVEKYLVPVDQ